MNIESQLMQTFVLLAGIFCLVWPTERLRAIFQKKSWWMSTRVLQISSLDFIYSCWWMYINNLIAQAIHTSISLPLRSIIQEKENGGFLPDHARSWTSHQKCALRFGLIGVVDPQRKRLQLDSLWPANSCLYTHLIFERAVKALSGKQQTPDRSRCSQDHRDRTAGGEIPECERALTWDSGSIWQSSLVHAFRLFRLGLFKSSRTALFAWSLADFLFPTDCFRVFIVAFSSCPYNEANFG